VQVQYISEQLWPILGVGNTEEFAGRLAGILSLTVGYGWYIRSILIGDTKPPVLAWAILTGVSVIMLSTFVGAGAGETIWIPASNLLGTILVFGLALKNRLQKRGEDPLTFQIREIISFCLAGLALLIFWFFTDQEQEAFYLVLSGEVLALSIIIENAWKKPEEESAFAWWGTATANLINFWAISSTVDWVYVSVTGLLDGLVFVLVMKPIIRAGVFLIGITHMPKKKASPSITIALYASE
jgi:hypothetical protein